jgi:colanic acid/amylovoran biosynthesis glycosyltransferase
VYTGLDLSKFNFQPQVVKNDKLQLVSVGRSHWIKGYEYALKACALLNKQGIDFKYTIIGAAGDEELLFLVDDLDLQDHVTLTDKLPQAKVFELMQKSDLLLLPSLEEGIANVAVEAMALGCPVISTDCGGMQELITHDEEGWIVPIRDPEAMADQILEFSKKDTNEISKIKKKARSKVELHHTEEQMVEGMVRLYSRVVG